MENKRGSGLFLSVIGVATLVVAIIGATFAYFSATAESANDAIAVQSTELDLGFDEGAKNLKTNMIPSKFDYADYAAFDPTWKNTEEKVWVYTEFDEDGKGIESSRTQINAPGQCIDQNGNEICSVYEFYIGNPSATTKMDVEGYITVTANGFEHLKYAIYDERILDPDNADVTPIAQGTFVDPEEVTDPVKVSAFTQTLIPYDAENGESGVTVDGTSGVAFDAAKPSTFKAAVDKKDPANIDTNTNVRHYTMLIWIDEINDDQTEVDSGKMFAAGITFKTGGASGGVTGVVAVAG